MVSTEEAEEEEASRLMDVLNVDFQKLYKPYPQQQRIVASKAPRNLFLGGIGSGKTQTLVLWSLVQSLTYPGSYGCILGRTEKKDAILVLANRLLEVLERWKEETGINLIAHFNRQDNILELVNGSRIAFRGFLQVDKLRGMEFQYAALDELFYAGECDDEYVFDTIAGRLRGGTYKGKAMLITCSPKGLTPVLRRFLKAQQNGKGKEWFVVRAKTADNPYIDPEDIARMCEGLSNRRLRQGLYAEIIRPDHVVYSEYDEARHIKPFDWKQNQRNPWILGIDWGTYRHHVALDIRVDPYTYTWCVADELVPLEDMPRTKFRTLLRKWLDKRATAPAVACADRAVPTENGWLSSLLKRTQIVTMESKNQQRVVSGIEQVRDMLDPAEDEPRLLFADNLERQLKGQTSGILPAMLNYRWLSDRYGNVTNTPYHDDVYSHITDALRYAVVGCRADKRFHSRLPQLVGLPNDGFTRSNRVSHHRAHF